jgi:adenosine deaminase
MLTRDLVLQLPKAELHLHFDGSLRPATMIDLARAAGVSLPTNDPEDLKQQMLASDVHNLEEYLELFSFTIGVLQTPDAIERVAYEIAEDAAADNVRYFEIRYCPALSTREGLSQAEVLEAQLRGLERGERDFGVKSRIINCALRSLDPAISIEVARVSVEFRDKGVVGFDLAGAEAGHPPGAHGEAFDIAAAGCLAITVHAGEAAGPESIAEAVHRCHADRIGHGTRLREDPRLQNYLRDHRMCLETNITSNVQTRVVPRASAHPVRGYFDAGLTVTLCTDNWLMCGVSLTDEYWLAHQELGFTRREIDQMIQNAFANAFLPLPERQTLLAEVTAELEALT